MALKPLWNFGIASGHAVTPCHWEPVDSEEAYTGTGGISGELEMPSVPKALAPHPAPDLQMSPVNLKIQKGRFVVRVCGNSTSQQNIPSKGFSFATDEIDPRTAPDLIICLCLINEAENQKLAASVVGASPDCARMRNASCSVAKSGAPRKTVP